MRTVCYERKPEIWIGEEEGSDIHIPGIGTGILLLADRYVLKLKEEDAGRILLNDELVTQETGAVSEGDEFKFYTQESELPVILRVFSDSAELESAGNAWTDSLIPIRGQGEHFPGFPYYTRSPRINYHIEDML